MATNDVLTWKIKVEGGDYKIDLSHELDIDLSDLTEEMRVQPGKFAWFAALHEKLKLAESQSKNDLQVVYAKLDEEMRNVLAAEGSKVTEASVRNRILSEARYIKAQKKYDLLSYKVGLLKVAREAFVQKKDMLIQLSANSREEFKNDE